MAKASDLRADGNTSILMKGPFGFGKTLAAASFALNGPIFLAYFDKSKPVELLTYFKKFGAKGKKILDNIDYEVYGANNAHEYLNKMIELSQDCRYTAIITDSVTNLTSAAVNWSLGFRDPKGKKDKLNKNAPAMIPDFDEYKVETSLVTQALDLSKKLPCHVIWIAHPLPVIKVEGSGGSVRVTKAVNIVTYGSKVAGIVPGNFTEIYHFSKVSNWDSSAGSSSERFVVNVRGIGDDFAKSPLLGDDIKELDITDKLFYEVWREAIDKAHNATIESTESTNNEAAEATTINNPFATTQQPKWRV